MVAAICCHSRVGLIAFFGGVVQNKICAFLRVSKSCNNTVRRQQIIGKRIATDLDNSIVVQVFAEIAMNNFASGAFGKIFVKNAAKAKISIRNMTNI